MSGFRQPVTTAQIVAAGALLASNNLSDVAAAATALININGVPRTVAVNAQVNDYTLTLSDLGKLVTMTKATPITLTVPTNASVAFSVGDEILIAQRGAGQLTVAAAGGVTINPAATLKLTAQYIYACLTQVSANVWDLVGALTA